MNYEDQTGEDLGVNLGILPPMSTPETKYDSGYRPPHQPKVPPFGIWYYF